MRQALLLPASALAGAAADEHPCAFAMRRAVELAERGRFATCPNPTVGAVLVREGRIVAEGWHRACGEAHAEINCLEDARRQGIDPATCTLVVTLEPCNHHGKTPPCAQAVYAAGIKHVVVGLRDPNPTAAGGGEYLAARGVTVEYGVEEVACRDLVADFLRWITTDQPYVILKLAATLDGKIATRTGHSHWVSSAASRQSVHALRAGMGRAGGAVLVGGGTFRADNPRLTARDTGQEADIPQPLACVLTSRLPAPGGECRLLRERPQETLFIATPAAAASPAALALREQGVRVWSFAAGNTTRGQDFSELLRRMRAELGCHYVLCEGGGRLALALLEGGAVDEFRLHLAPGIMGDNEAIPLFQGRSPLAMSEVLPLRISGVGLCGGDMHLTLRPVGDRAGEGAGDKTNDGANGGAGDGPAYPQ